MTRGILLVAGLAFITGGPCNEEAFPLTDVAEEEDGRLDMTVLEDPGTEGELDPLRISVFCSFKGRSGVKDGDPARFPLTWGGRTGSGVAARNLRSSAGSGSCFTGTWENGQFIRAHFGAEQAICLKRPRVENIAAGALVVNRAKMI